MALTKDAPSSNRFSPFYCEQAVVVDVNRANWTCVVETMHSAKSFRDVPWGTPYHHYTGGEGLHFMPEVGAHCYLASPVDNTPPFILAFIAPPAVKEAAGDAPLRPTSDGAGSSTDVSYQSNRPDLNPGDIGMTTRDGNFLYLRRGGIVQFGASPMAQRICVPVRNFIHDFCENYELATPGGDVAWIIDRPELDPAGEAASSYTFHLLEYATDKKATVRVRHLPLAASGGDKAAWEVTIAPQGVDRTSGAISGETYTLMVMTTGAKTEMIGATRETWVKGDDTLKVDGKQDVVVKGDSTHKAKNVTITSEGTSVVDGKAVHLGDPNASEPVPCGNKQAQWVAQAQVLTAMGPAPFAPPTIQAFQDVLSKKVMTK